MNLDRQCQGDQSWLKTNKLNAEGGLLRGQPAADLRTAYIHVHNVSAIR